MFIAMPKFNGCDKKTFDKLADAVAYLEEFTGYEMSFEYPKGVKKLPENRIYDWELVGKLVRV